MTLDTPIMQIEPVFNIPEMMVDQQATTTRAGSVRGCAISCTGIMVCESRCGGTLSHCDVQGLVSPTGEVRAKCACYSSNGVFAPPIISMTIKFEKQGEEARFDRSFTSKSFIKDYILSHPIPHNVSAATINNNRRLKKTLKRAIQSCCQKINDSGGAEIFFWYKPGQINDQTEEAMNAETSNGWNQNQNNVGQVQSSNINYHIVSILPSNPMNINLAEMNDLKINVGERMNS